VIDYRLGTKTAILIIELEEHPFKLDLETINVIKQFHYTCKKVKSVSTLRNEDSIQLAGETNTNGIVIRSGIQVPLIIDNRDSIDGEDHSLHILYSKHIQCSIRIGVKIHERVKT